MTENRQIVATRFGQIHLRVNGERGSALVLLHMSPQSSRMWAPLQKRLSRQTVAVDRLGYGFSDPPLRQLTMAQYATSVLEAVEALQGDERFDVIGMHTGALEALELAHLAGNRVRRVGMVALPIFNPEEKANGLNTFAQMRVTPAEDGSHLLPAWRARFQHRTPPFDMADVQRRYVDYLLAPYPGQAYNAVYTYEAESRLRSLQSPLVVFAPHDDLYELTLRSRAILPPTADFVDLPEWELDFPRTRAAQFAGLVEKYFPQEG